MRAAPPPTQKQMAARLGVSQALVSRALSGRAAEIGASRETVERIRSAAAEWNYQPDATALALLGAPTKTIGVVVKNFDDPFFGHLIGALQGLARESGHSLLLTGGGPGDLAALRKHKVDGVILAGSDFEPDGVSSQAAGGMPFVQIGTGTTRAGVRQVRMDEAAGLAELVARLAGLGHTEIGFVGSSRSTNQRRGDGLRRRLRLQGLPVREKWFFTHPGDGGEIASAAVRNFLALRRRPTAVIAAEDSIALPLLRFFHEAGLRVPQDVSVAGIDGIPASAQSIPPLTTLQQPMRELAAAAFHALTGHPGKNRPIPVKGTVIFRASCAPPHRSS